MDDYILCNLQIFKTMIIDINREITKAIQEKNSTRLTVLRALKSELTNTSLRKGNVQAELTDSEILGVIRKKIGQATDSITQFESGNRPELAAKELLEKTILEGMLPKQLSEETVDSFVRQAIAFHSATSRKQMGLVMKKVLELVDGQADPKVISQKIMSILQ